MSTITNKSAGKTITKKELVERIAGSTKERRGDVKQVLQLFLDLILDELGHGNRIEFRDFGVFEVKERAPRTAQNPKTLQRVLVPARRTVKFKAGRQMRSRLEGVPTADGRTSQIEAKNKRSA
jgi:integration host factor subunit beta